jgi:glycosyltransferase involved in cell wall biosynthesis
MNILFITENLFPDVMGGSGRVVQEFGLSLIRLGHAVTILTRAVAGLPETEEVGGMQIIRYACGNPLNMHRSIKKQLQTLTQKTRIELVLLEQPLPGLSALLSGELQNALIIREFHGPWHDEYRVKTGKKCPVNARVALGVFLRKQIDSYTLKRSKKIRVLSNYMKSEVLRIDPRLENKILVVPGGVNANRFHPAESKTAVRAELNIPQGRRLLFTVRNLTPRMGIQNLIPAMERIIKTHADALLHIGGSGPLHESLTRMINSCGLTDHVKLLGRISDDDLKKYYQAADLFILPTRDLEGFGLVTLEAMASGAAVLATPQGATPEIAKGFEKLFLFDNATTEAMAEKIEMILSEPLTLMENQQTALQLANQFSWESQARQIIREAEAMI